MLGKIEVNEGNYDNGWKIFSKLIEIDSNVNHLVFLIKCEIELKNFKSAIKFCDKALLMKGNFFKISIKKLSCLIQINELE